MTNKDTIEIDRKALKQRGNGYVFYNYEWFKKHFATESKLIMGEPYIPLSVIEKIKAEIKAMKYGNCCNTEMMVQNIAYDNVLGLIDQAIKECDA